MEWAISATLQCTLPLLQLQSTPQLPRLLLWLFTTHHHVPVTHTTHAVTYGAGGSADSEVYPDEIIPYSYEYTVSDPETNNNFNAVESDDGTGVRSGSYSVSLPDLRIQHVVYTTDADGYVATVTYEGTAVFPDIV